jgi:alpha-2-macroglobulin-like protein
MKDDRLRCPRCGASHPPDTPAPACAPDPAVAPSGSAEVSVRRAAAGEGERLAPASLVVRTAEGERAFDLRSPISIGRDARSSIQVLDKVVSKDHCRVEREGERYVLRDLDSLNGTFLNGERVRGAVALAHGDAISVGSLRATFDHALAAPVSDEPFATPVSARFLAHLTLARPFYRPGEMLYARAVILDVEGRAPIARAVDVEFEVRSRSRAVIAHRAASAAEGVVPFAWAIPAGTAAGEHTLVALFPRDRAPPAEITFAIHAYCAPQIDAAISFGRDAYGPGDEVVATLSIAQIIGAPVAEARASVVAIVDGVEIHRKDHAFDALAGATVRFRMPEVMESGLGVLCVLVALRGVKEAVTRPIPIAVRRVDLAVIPESGARVIGLPARLYVEARSPRGGPAAVAGRLVDASGALVASFCAEHEGRARLDLSVVEAGRAHRVIVDEPADAVAPLLLPEAKAEGVVVTARDDVTAAGAPVCLGVVSTRGREVKVALYAREREIAAAPLTLAAGALREIALSPGDTVSGVLRAVVLDATGEPLAERLVFRRPRRAVAVTITAEPQRAPLGAEVTLVIRTTDERGAPISATVTLAVVDGAVIEATPARERAPRLPAQALLESEVRALFDPGAYLGDDAASARRLDLLLGVQAFRRFAFQDPPRFLAEHGVRAARVLGERWRPSARASALIDMPPRAASTLADLATMPEAFAVAASQGSLSLSRRAGATREPGRGGRTVGHATSAPRRAARPALLPAEAPSEAHAAIHEYAHRAPLFDGTRANLAETLYWNAGLVTDARGEATVRFDLSDVITTFHVYADAFDASGALGEGEARIASCSPFIVRAAFPAELGEGDVLDLPVTLVNETAVPFDARLSLLAADPLRPERDRLWIALPSRGQAREILPIKATSAPATTATVRVAASAGAFADEATGYLAVVPRGVPVELCASGELTPGGDGARAAHRLTIDEGAREAGLTAEVLLTPTPLSMIGAALDALGREPALGVEPALAITHIAALAQGYLAARPGDGGRLYLHAAAQIDSAVAALARAAGTGRGYGFFHAEAPDLALTAHAVRVLGEAARAHPVDPEPLARARRFLLERGLEDDVADATPRGDAARAQVAWALGLVSAPWAPEARSRLGVRARATGDGYLLAVAVNAFADAGEHPIAKDLGRILAGSLDVGGAVRGARASVSFATGEALDLEATSLAALALGKIGARDDAARARAFLLRRREAGRFGAAHATALALEALIALDGGAPPPLPSSLVRLRVDGVPRGATSVPAGHDGGLALPSFASALDAGVHLIELELEGSTAVTYALRVRYAATTLPPAAGALRLATALTRAEISEGEAVELLVDVSDVAGEPLPPLVAVLGVPAGLRIDERTLEALVDARQLDAWEARGRELSLYRGPSVGARWAVTVGLAAAFPGVYLGAPSRVQPLYEPSARAFAPPLRACVRPAGVTARSTRSS